MKKSKKYEKKHEFLVKIAEILKCILKSAEFQIRLTSSGKLRSSRCFATLGAPGMAFPSRVASAIASRPLHRSLGLPYSSTPICDNWDPVATFWDGLPFATPARMGYRGSAGYWNRTSSETQREVGMGLRLGPCPYVLRIALRSCPLRGGPIRSVFIEIIYSGGR